MLITLSSTDAGITERVRMRFAQLVRSQCPATRAIGYHAIFRHSRESDAQDFALAQLRAHTRKHASTAGISLPPSPIAGY